MKKKSDKDIYILHLFIAGASPRSTNAIINIKKICTEYLDGMYKLQVIDIYQQPNLLLKEQITAIPVLIKKSPLPEIRMIGDLSDKDMVLKGLNIKTKKE